MCKLVDLFQDKIQIQLFGDLSGMFTYLGLHFFLMLSAWAGTHGRQIAHSLYYFLLTGLTIFVGFRVNVGCDYHTYQHHYSFGADGAFLKATTGMDPAYWLLVSALNYMSLHSQAINVVASIIFFLGLGSLAKRQPAPLHFLAFCFPILILNMPMSATRQSMAIGLMCLAFVALVDRRVVLYFFWTFAAATFHSSAAVFLFLLPFIRNKITLKSLVYGLVFIVPLIAVLAQTDAANQADSRYLQSGPDAAGAIFRLAILTLTGMLFFVFLSPPWRQNFAGDYHLVKIGSLMMIGVFGLYFASSVIGDRFGYYLIPIQAIIFSRISFLDLGRMRRAYTYLAYTVLTATLIVWMSFSWHFSQCYVPYNFGYG
ncbi:EpsG family protein [bacterium]|nr:EpsG family protein [bacterium]